MWIKFKHYGRDVLANVQRFGIEPTPIITAYGNKLEGATIVDLDVTEKQDLIGWMVEDMTEAMGGRIAKYNPSDHEYCAGELSIYDSYDRAEEVLKEIQDAIESGQVVYQMPDA